MNREELKNYLLKEEKRAFQGWDFSYLEGRWESGVLPWDYKTIVLEYLNPNLTLLDMETGGGEFLLTLNHPFNKTGVTEGYPPNVLLCKKRLSPLGIKVYEVKNDNHLPIEDDSFDLIINKHGSYNIGEVKRILKSGGIFITQQVGGNNDLDLASFFDKKQKSLYPDHNLEKNVQTIFNAGFEIVKKDEAFPKLKFYDIGAVVYFAKIIEWEFKDFSVNRHFDKLYQLAQDLETKGYVESTEHRFLIVARNKK